MPLPIRLVVVSWPALSRKMQLCSSSGSLSRSPSTLALDQPRQHVLVRVTGVRRRAATRPSRQRHEAAHRRDCRAPARRPPAPAPAPTGSPATSRAAAPRSACGTSSRLPITSTGMRAAKSSIRSGASSVSHAVEQPVDQRRDAGFHARDGALAQGAHHQPAHARVQRRIVEHEAGGVVLEQRRVAELRHELAPLVGAGARVAVQRGHVVVAREQQHAGRQLVHRRALAQRGVERVGVVDEPGRRIGEAEGAKVERHPAILPLAVSLHASRRTPATFEAALSNVHSGCCPACAARAACRQSE